MEQHQALTLVDLPHHAISKIIYERWNMDNKYQHVLSILFTCKQIYYEHYHILYMLRPLVLGKAENSTSSKDLQKLIQIRACCKIRKIYVVRPSKSLILQVEMFPNLKTASISTSLKDLLNIVYKLPPTVTELNLCLTKNGLRATTTEILNVPTFKLKRLKFSSVRCIRRTRFSSFYDTIMGPITRITTDPNYYKRSSPGKLVCNLLARLIKDNISTLVMLDFETVHFDQINLVLKELIFNFGSPNRLQVIKVNQLGSDQNTTYKLIDICKELHFTNNHLGLKYIIQKKEEGLIQKIVATKRP